MIPEHHDGTAAHGVGMGHPMERRSLLQEPVREHLMNAAGQRIAGIVGPVRAGAGQALTQLKQRIPPGPIDLGFERSADVRQADRIGRDERGDGRDEGLAAQSQIGSGRFRPGHVGHVVSYSRRGGSSCDTVAR